MKPLTLRGRLSSWPKQPLLALALCGFISSHAWATQPYIFTLADGNASATVDLGTQAGMSDLNVDGRDQMDQQWFWYRIGNEDAEHSINSIGWPSVSQPTAGTLAATYSDHRISIEVLYTLVGGTSGSGTATVSEQIRIQNLSSHSQDLHFYQYADLNAAGISELGRNSQGDFNEAQVTSAADSISYETSTPADHAVAGLNTVPLLNDSHATTLLDAPGPSTNCCWTFEWDQPVGAKSTLIVGQVIYVNPLSVPEPSGWTLAVVGLLACYGLGRITRKV